MKTYLYWEYKEPYPEHPTEMTEEAILKFFWDYWKGQMDKKFGPNHHLTTHEGCIDDWVIVHWAWEKPLSSSSEENEQAEAAKKS